EPAVPAVGQPDRAPRRPALPRPVEDRGARRLGRVDHRRPGGPGLPRDRRRASDGVRTPGVPPPARAPAGQLLGGLSVRVALLTYSTRARGGVVHTLALAEALTAHAEVTVYSLARGGDDAFFRPVAPDVDVRLVPYPEVVETVGERVARSIERL